jgi:hypothetical protein
LKNIVIIGKSIFNHQDFLDFSFYARTLGYRFHPDETDPEMDHQQITAVTGVVDTGFF